MAHFRPCRLAGLCLLLTLFLGAHPADSANTALAYLDATSYAAGETLVVRASSSIPFLSVRINRLGGSTDSMATFTDLPAESHPVPDSAWIKGCDWPVLLSTPVPDSWKSGLYEVRVMNPGGTLLTRATFLVRGLNTGAELLVISAVNTWQAYNAFGGKSLYDYNSFGGRAPRVTFNRPYDSNGGLGQLTKYELPFARWIDQSGLRADYATDVDLATRPSILDGHRALVVVGHDEYWSAGMYAAARAFADTAGNVAVLGANTCMWAVRYEENARTLVCYKSYSDPMKPDYPESTTVQWRDPLLLLPECGFFGGLTPSCESTVSLPVRFNRLYSWITDGLEAEVGHSFGENVLGYEFDVYLPGFSPVHALPLFQTPVGGPCPQTHSGTYYELQPGFGLPGSGGGIFNAGTIQWSWGLSSTSEGAPDPRIQLFTRNLLSGMTHRLAAPADAAVLFHAVLLDSAAGPGGPVQARISSAEDTTSAVFIDMLDDGIWPDTLAGDRVYTGRLAVRSGDRFPRVVDYEIGGLQTCFAGGHYLWLEEATRLDSLYSRQMDTLFSCGEVVAAGAAPKARLRLVVGPNPGVGLQRVRWSGAHAVSELALFSADGRRLRLLRPAPGNSFVDWDGSLQDGSRASSGIYWARAKGPSGTSAVRLVRLR